jgi:hypothetical protein
MRIPLTRPTRPTILVFGSVMVGVLIAGGGPQVGGMWDRPACAEKVMKAVSTDKPVAGTIGCFDHGLQNGLQTLGIDSDRSFATRVGQNGEYHFVHKTADGGYVYEYDRLTAQHDRWQGALTDLGWSKITADLKRGDLGAAWREVNDFGAAWAEVSGQTQRPQSTLFTFYLDGGGKVTSVK